MKKLIAMVLSLILALSMAVPAFATEAPEGWTPADATESIVYLVSANVNSLDVLTSTGNLTMRAINYLLFDPLFTFDEDGNVQGWLAEKWEMADDYMSCVVHLRDEVYFTNGEKLTADDVAYSFDRILTDTDRIPSERNWRPYLESVEVIDELTCKFNFISPMPTFFYRAATPETVIMSKSAYEATSYDDFWNDPVGTGAYVVESWDAPNSNITLTLRQDEKGYWAYNQFGTGTNVKNITMNYSAEGQTRVYALEAGDAQMIDVVPIENVENLKNEGFDVNQINGTTVVFLETAQGEGEVFEDVNLRKALSLAIDRELVVETLLGGSGVPATWGSRPGDYGWIDGVSETGYIYDVEEAKRLVAESDYDGSPIHLIYSTATVQIGVELTQALQAMWKEVGLNVEIDMQEDAIYGDNRTNGNYDISLCCIIGAGNMWINAVQAVVVQDRWSTHYMNDEIKEIGTKISTTCDPELLRSLFEELYQLEVPFFGPDIMLYFPNNYGARVSGLTGVQWHGLDTPDMSSVWLTK